MTSNDRAELDRFKTAINLTEFAAAQGYTLDRRESSRNSAVMRREKDKIIVTRQGEHWIYFSVRDDRDNGTIVDFVMRRDAGGSLGAARQALRRWTSQPRPPIEPSFYAPELATITRDRAAIMRGYARLNPITEHPALTARGIPPALLSLPRFARCVLMDDHGNACFPHHDTEGVAGWEIKNRGFTGYAKGGSKGLWFSRTTGADMRLVMTESAIDALSYAALFPDDHARYFSTGGSLNPDQPALIRRALEKMPGPAALILATDNDEAGHALAAAIQSLAPIGAEIRRPLPTTGKDWNDQLRAH